MTLVTQLCVPTPLWAAKDQVRLDASMDTQENLDTYTQALYDLLFEASRQSPTSSDKRLIQSFLDHRNELQQSRTLTPQGLTASYDGIRPNISNSGGVGCLNLEYGLAQINLLAQRSFQKSKQNTIASATNDSLQTIRKQASCLSEHYNEGLPLNLTPEFTFLDQLLREGTRNLKNPAEKLYLEKLFKTYLSLIIQGTIDAHSFNMNRIKAKFQQSGITLNSIEDVRTETFKQSLLAKAKVSALFITGLSGFLTAFFGSGFIVEKGLAASVGATTRWNQWVSPILNKLSRGRLVGRVKSFEKASYILSSGIIGALGGSSLHALSLAADTLKTASVQSFSKDSSLGAELIPTMQRMMSSDKIKDAVQHGASIGLGAGGLLTIGVFEYNLPKPLKPNSIRHAVLSILSAAVIYSTAVSGKDLIEHLIEGQKALALSHKELKKITESLSDEEKAQILKQAKDHKTHAYDAFGDAALAGLDLTVLAMLVNELFIRGELYHIWNAHESQVIDAVARGSDEIPGAANNISQGLQPSNPGDLATAKTSQLLGSMGDDAAKVSGIKASGIKASGIKASGLNISGFNQAADDLGSLSTSKINTLGDLADDIINSGAMSSKTGSAFQPLREDLH